MTAKRAAAKAEIRVETRESGPVAREIQVEVPVARVRVAFDRGYRDLAQRAELPGFRRGKAPRRVLERRFGAGLAEEIERVLVAETLEEALERADLQPLGEPAIEARPPRPDADFRYTIRIEVRPQIALPELSGLPGRRASVEVADPDVEAELERLRLRHAPVLEEPEGSEAGPGHILSLDFVGRVDDKPFEGGSGRGVELEMGAGRFIPGFEEQLAGARSGEDREVRVTFPEDYGQAQLRGKEAVFQVHVAALKRRHVPVLDDEFAKDLGDFDSLDALRAQVRTDMEAMRRREAEGVLRRSLMDALIERTPFEVPPGLVERERDRRLERARRQLGDSVPQAALEQQIGRWREAWRKEAEREVRETLLLEAVAAQEKLSASDAEVEARVTDLAREQGVTAKQLREALGEGAVEGGVRSRLVEEKALEFLAARAKFDPTPDS